MKARERMGDQPQDDGEGEDDYECMGEREHGDASGHEGLENSVVTTCAVGVYI